MKRLQVFVLLTVCLASLNALAVNIYVSPSGNDLAPGTSQRPLATLQKALRVAREMRRLKQLAANDTLYIVLKGGTYPLAEPVFIRPEDSGTATSPTFIMAAPAELPILSGGTSIGDWHLAKGNIAGLPAKAKGKVWVADAPLSGDRVIDFRQLWVNGVKAIRARESNADSMGRILSWNHHDETCMIPRPHTANLAAVKGMEMFIHQMWAIAILRIKSYEPMGDSAKLTFMQPESRVQAEHPWPAPFISKKTGNSAFYLSNAIAFLDEPGEWYLDKLDHKIYYWPRHGEDLRTAKVIAPVLENLVKVEGSADHPVSNISFSGIAFAYCSWLYPSQNGLVPHQAGMYMLDAYKLPIPGTPDKKGLENQAWVGRPQAAVKLNYADRIGFNACLFEHLASTGLDMERGDHEDEVKGCLFKDIGGSGLLAGVFSDEETEVHLPYNPTDTREVCTGIRISNNLVTDVTNEDWGCVGIGAGYVKSIAIEHNEVYNVSYTGISVGWGWTKTINAMSGNYIYANKISHYARFMYDVAGIYTLSAQPGTTINENYVDSIYKAAYPHDPHHWFYLYLDEGSSYISVKDNWCPSDKFLKNANGPGNTWDNNGPMVSDKIKNAAGLEPAYQYLLSQKTYYQNNQAINHDEKK